MLWSVSPGRPPPPSANSTTGRFSRCARANSRSFFAWLRSALRAGEHRVVVGHRHDPAAVDHADAGHHAVRGRAFDQIVQRPALALGGDREAAVLDEGGNTGRRCSPVRSGRPGHVAEQRLTAGRSRGAPAPPPDPAGRAPDPRRQRPQWTHRPRRPAPGPRTRCRPPTPARRRTPGHDVLHLHRFEYDGVGIDSDHRAGQRSPHARNRFLDHEISRRTNDVALRAKSAGTPGSSETPSTRNSPNARRARFSATSRSSPCTTSFASSASYRVADPVADVAVRVDADARPGGRPERRRHAARGGSGAPARPQPRSCGVKSHVAAPGEQQLRAHEVHSGHLSVTVCSTCSRGLTSRNANESPDTRNSTVPTPV